MDQIKEFIEGVQQGQNNVISLVRKVLDGKENVTVELVNKKAEPVRAESPARAHVFHTASGFIDFVGKNKTPNTIVLADTENLCVAAVLDDKAEKGFEVVELRPLYWPQFKLLNDTLLGAEDMDIHKFGKQVMRNREIIVTDNGQSGRDIAMLMQQITVASKITACSGSGKTSVNGVMIHTEVKAGTGEELVEIPDTIKVSTPIWFETEVVEFGLDITMAAHPRGEFVKVIVDSPELAMKQAKVFERMLEPIKAMEGVLVALGNYQTAGWRYI